MRSPAIVAICLVCCCLLPCPAPADELRVQPLPEPLRQELRLDAFYKKCVLTKGFPVVGSEKVNDYALLEAAFLIDRMLAGREDLRQALIKHKVRFGILAASEFTTDLPEYRDLKPPLFWKKRARGLGAAPGQPLVSCGEENLLNAVGDPYEGENILIHEFAHAIHGVALREVDPTFDERLSATFAEARRQGLWKYTYAMANKGEYWAEGVQSWFDCNKRLDPQHNGIATREKLLDYDPRFGRLLSEVFKDNTWRYQRPALRKEPAHLAGLEHAKIPAFAWSSGMSSSTPFARTMRAVFGAMSSNARMASPVLLRARNSKTCPKSTRVTMTAADSKYTLSIGECCHSFAGF